jgi:N-acetylgalactosamine PTS system EIIB component
MSIVLFRIDNRLIHGQVIASWVPQLEIEAIIVADDEMAQDEFATDMARLAVSEEIELFIIPTVKVIETLRQYELGKKRVLILLRDIAEASRAVSTGLKIKSINLGNLHFSEGKRQICPTIAINERDVELMRELEAKEIEIEIRAVPSEKSRRALDLL